MYIANASGRVKRTKIVCARVLSSRPHETTGRAKPDPGAGALLPSSSHLAAATPRVQAKPGLRRKRRGLPVLLLLVAARADSSGQSVASLPGVTTARIGDAASGGGAPQPHRWRWWRSMATVLVGRSCVVRRGQMEAIGGSLWGSIDGSGRPDFCRPSLCIGPLR
jgi:hypothetical protein